MHGLVLWRGSLLIMAGAMTVGALTIFLAYLVKFFQPVRDLAQMTNTIAQVAVAFDRVRAVTDADKVIPEDPAAKDPPPFRGEIAFEHVAFGYDPAVPVLHDITFTISPARWSASSAPPAAASQLSSASSRASVTPTPARSPSTAWTSATTSFADCAARSASCCRTPCLLRGTVRSNIAFGRPDATEDEIIEAAKLANAHEFITRMPQGYDSPVGERGSTLSGGQRQRIGIARALIRDNPILILDEPTAALDAESEHLVIEALERLMTGRTVITIAHRLSTLRSADKIIVIQDGVVAEDGTHDELLKLDGVYAQLCRLQFDSHTNESSSVRDGGNETVVVIAWSDPPQPPCTLTEQFQLALVVPFDRSVMTDADDDGVRQLTAQQLIQRQLEAFVQCGGGFVEEYRLGSGQQDPGERDALLLTG